MAAILRETNRDLFGQSKNKKVFGKKFQIVTSTFKTGLKMFKYDVLTLFP